MKPGMALGLDPRADVDHGRVIGAGRGISGRRVTKELCGLVTAEHGILPEIKGVLSTEKIESPQIGCSVEIGRRLAERFTDLLKVRQQRRGCFVRA